MASYNTREDNPYLPETTRTDEEDPLAKDEAEWGEAERAAVRAMFPEPEMDAGGPCPNDQANCGGPGYVPVDKYTSRCSECHGEWLGSDLHAALDELEADFRQRFLDQLPDTDSVKEEEEREARIELLAEWDGWETEAFDFPEDLTEHGY